jgi:FkbH-like protein/FkbM family methyltransferase
VIDVLKDIVMRKRRSSGTTSPLVGQPRDAAAAHAWDVELQPSALPYLADHRLQGVPVLPGAVVIEMALAAATAAQGATPHLLESIAFQRAVFLAKSGAQSLRVVLAEQDGGAIFQVFSRPADDAQVSDDAYASIGIPRQPPARVQPPAPADLAAIRARCAHELDATAFYAELNQHGNQYGPAFQGIERLWRGDDEALSVLRVPGALEHDHAAYHVPPVLLDAAAQTLLAADQREDTRTVVLLGIEQLRRYHALDMRCWAHARCVAQPSDDTLVGDVRLLDEAGRVAVELLGIRFKRLAAEAPAATQRPPALQIAVAATFTAEPLADALTFWMQQFDTPAEIGFAPYNQPFQQLLDPASLLSTNRSGMNVILLRFEDWLMRAGESADAVDPAERERLLEGRSRYTLPNRMTIAQLNQYETAYLYDEIFTRRTYLQHGITLHDDDCVIDIGANIGLFTLFVQQSCPNARIYAFEPAPPAFAALQTNAALYAANAKVFNCGISDRNAEALFTFYRTSSLFSGYHAEIAQDREAIRAIIRNMLRQRGLADTQSLDQVTDDLLAGRLQSERLVCPLRTLSSVIDEQRIERIDLLKIDAEKSELEILNGIAAADWGKIRQIVIEVHDHTGERLPAIRALLAARGFALHVAEDELLRESGLYTIYAHGSAGMAVRPGDTRSATDARLEQMVRDLSGALHSMRERSTTPHFVCICPASPAALQDADQRALFERLERQMAAALSDLDTLELISAADVFAAYPVPDYDDPLGEQLGHVPYTSGFFAALATLIVRKYQSRRRAPYKVIVLDCDQTLWQGICGEDGPLRVVLDSPRKALQEFMVGQHDAGMLLCLCSKNNVEDVAAVFDLRPEMPLTRAHIAAWRLNWLPKSANILSLAAELRVGLDSCILIDDDPVECAEVQARCPDVLTLQLPADASAIPTFLAHCWAFDQRERTETDRQRTRLYQQNRQREELQSSLTFAAFLAELELRVRVAVPAPDQLTRVAQLTQRTNQFNMTTLRRSEAELRTLIDAAGYECLVAEVSDRFGDYGLVGVLLFTRDPAAIVVDSFLLSCRALGRGVEHQMLARLGQLACEQGRERVDMPYLPSGKNQPGLAFLQSVGARFSTPLREHTRLPQLIDAPAFEHGRLFAFPASFLRDLRYDVGAADAVLGALSDAPPGDDDQARAERADRRVTAAALRRIALELYDVEHILAMIESQKSRERPAAAGAFVAPSNELERAIKSVWQEVLGVADVGITDSFFALGGTSLAAILVASELKRRLDVDISTINLFAQTTIGSLAEMLKSTGEAEWSEKIAVRRQRGEQRRARNIARLRGS